DAAAHPVVGVGPDQAVGHGDDASDPRGGVAPGHGPAVAVPVLAADHVVAVAQAGDAAQADLIIWGGADEAVCRGGAAAAPGGAAPTGHRPAAAVPARSGDHVVAVSQQADAAAHAVAGVGADQAIDLGDGPADPRGGVRPGHRPAAAVPVRTEDQVVAVQQ